MKQFVKLFSTGIRIREGSSNNFRHHLICSAYNGVEFHRIHWFREQMDQSHTTNLTELRESGPYEIRNYRRLKERGSDLWIKSSDPTVSGIYTCRTSHVISLGHRFSGRNAGTLKDKVINQQ